MKKLLATDLDGTLVYDQIKIEEKNLQAIQKLKEQSHYLVIATGRGFSDSVFLKNDFQIDYDYMVLLNGALLIDKNDRVIKQDIIANHLVIDIYKKHMRNSWDMTFCTGFGYIRHNHHPSRKTEGDIFIDSLDKLKKHSISLISIECLDTPVEEIQATTDLINEQYGEQIIAYRNTHYIDVVPKGNSKGEGILEVAKLFDVSEEHIYTIGDSWNDVSMFEITENSFTFPHVEKKLQHHAKNVVNGVDGCIERMLVESEKMI